MNSMTAVTTPDIFRLAEFLSLLYEYSKPHYDNQRKWFRDLFYSYHRDCDKLYIIDEYLMSQSTISELLRSAYAKGFPRNMYRFYFSTAQDQDHCNCINDFCRYLHNTIFTEGRIQKLIAALTARVASAKNIIPGDRAYIMNFESTGNDSFEKAASLCYRILLVSIS